MTYETHWNKNGVTINSRDPHSNPWVCWTISWNYGGVVSRSVNHRDGTMTQTIFAPFAWVWRQGPFWYHRQIGTRLSA